MKRTVLLALLLCPTALHAASCATESFGSFAYYKSITINSLQVPSTQTGFPALTPFLGGDSDIAAHHLNANGYDVCPFASDKSTHLTYELVPGSWNAGTGAFEMHMNITAQNAAVVYIAYADGSINADASSAS